MEKTALNGYILDSLGETASRRALTHHLSPPMIQHAQLCLRLLITAGGVYRHTTKTTDHFCQQTTDNGPTAPICCLKYFIVQKHFTGFL